MDILYRGEALDLPAGFALTIEESSPVFNERGSQSLPATVPPTPRNLRLFEFPTRIDAGSALPAGLPEVTLRHGPELRRASLNITEASPDTGISFNLGFDNSIAYADWLNINLPDLPDLPVYEPQSELPPVDAVLDYLHGLYQRSRPVHDDLAVFPIAVGVNTHNADDRSVPYWDLLNVPGAHGLDGPAIIKRVIDGNVTELQVPPGYGVSPFMRVWRLLELAFGALGVTLEGNPFRDTTELARLVVLNNTADTVCRGSIRYADLMPDCTVGELLTALWVRFGLVYNINFDTARAELRLLRDILAERRPLPLGQFRCGAAKIIYDTPQYIKLSASTELTGAAPATERFEDFTAGCDMRDIKMGTGVDSWKPHPDHKSWDGDIRDDYFEPDLPDDRDDYDYRAIARTLTAESSPAPELPDGSVLAREFITGNFYRLDALNGATQLSSTPFFNWDPKPYGLSAMELQSPDQCVPLQRVSNIAAASGNPFNDHCPVYSAGARHRHSYIKGSPDDDSVTTPLAFMQAFTCDGVTMGRITPEGADGLPLQPDDGHPATLSLLFQFRDGLFNRFWAAYDEILRHSTRIIEYDAMLDAACLRRLPMLQPVDFCNIRCLIDTISYTVPSPGKIPATLRLRVINTRGSYDIGAEQSVPDLSAGARTLCYTFVSDDMAASAAAIDRAAVARDWIRSSGYRPHGSTGDAWYVDASAVEFIDAVPGLTTWSNDSTLPRPFEAGRELRRSYRGVAHFDIYELHDLTHGPDEDPDIERSEVPLARVSVEFAYTVRLLSAFTS